MAEVAIVYDPHLHWSPRYFSEERGDILLNPLDARCPSWSPSDEIDFGDGATAEAQALAQATSLFPGNPSDRNWFFTYCSQLIWKHCIVQHRPDAHEMAYLMQHSDPPFDIVVQGTELEQMMAANAQQQRAGVVSHLTQIAYALRQIPRNEKGRRHVSLREWCADRTGWLFFTNKQDTRAALRPIQSLMLDGLILRLLSMGERYDLPAVVMAIDELQALQKLPQLMPLVTEGRKSLRVVLGFQGRSQIKALYGEEAEAIFSAAYTKFMLRTSEPEASKWLSDTVGEVEIERLRKSRPAGLMTKSGHPFSNELQIERLVMPSQFQGLDDLHGYLKYGNHIVQLTLPIIDKRIRAVGFVPREAQPIKNKPLPNLQDVLARKKQEAERKKAAEEKRKAAAETGAKTEPVKAGVTMPAVKPSLPLPSSTGTAQSYYKTDFSAATNRYYSQEQTLQGRWQGELAADLGLKGAVTDEQFERLTNGQHPHTAEQLIKHRPESDKAMAHVAAWDLTFRPGKSISLAALVGGDERLAEVVRKANDKAIATLEGF